MRKEIEIWASKYAWTQLSQQQQKQVQEEMTAAEYKTLHEQLKELSSTEKPDRDTKALIMNKARKKNRPSALYYVAGLAAMLVLGYFLGGLKVVEFNFGTTAQVSQDTVIQKQVDTILITQTDTVTKTIFKDRYIVKNQTVSKNNTTNTVVESPIDEDYKVPAPKNYVLEFPKMERENNSPTIPLDYETTTFSENIRMQR